MIYRALHNCQIALRGNSSITLPILLAAISLVDATSDVTGLTVRHLSLVCGVQLTHPQPAMLMVSEGEKFMSVTSIVMYSYCTGEYYYAQNVFSYIKLNYTYDSKSYL